jgi:competence protein ComEC
MPSLPLFAAAFAGGTLAAATLGGPWWLTLLAAGALAGGLPVSGAAQRGTAGVLPLLAAVALAGAGHVRFDAAAARPAAALATVAGAHTVVAVARADATVSGSTARVDLTVEQLDSVAAIGGVRLTLRAPELQLRAGDRVTFRGTLAPPHGATPNYAASLRASGIDATAAFPSEWKVLARDVGPAPVRALRAVRRWSLVNLERSLPEPEAALEAGLLLGEQRSMPVTFTNALRATGTTHLVVVSGQNIAIVAGAPVAVLGVWLPRRRAGLLALAALPAYVVLVGAEPPVMRAAVMAVGITIAAAAGRRTPAWIFLAYAAAIMLAVDPLLARDVSFQLSAAATAGVLIVAPPLREAILSRTGASGPLAALLDTGAVATAAAAAVLPVQAAAFGTLSLLQVPANALVMPLYGGSLLVAACGALLGWLPPVAAALHLMGRLLPGAFIALVEVLARVPGATVPVRAPLAAGLAWYVLLAAALFVPRRREAAGLPLSASAGGLTLTAGLAVVAGGLWFAVLTPRAPYPAVTVLDVGQGLAVLVRDGGAAVLIDAGPPDGAAVAALARAGQGMLNALVLTHNNSDHTGGTDAIARRVGVTRLLTSSYVPTPAGHTVDRIDIGDRIHLSPRTTIEVLAPPVVTASSTLASDNDRGLVLLVTIGERRILLPADIEAAAEHWLATSGEDVHADVLVVPHHGSRTSSTVAFLAAVDPAAAVISVGTHNAYGHPHPDVPARYEEVPLYRTDLDGDVTVRSDGLRLWVAAARARATVPTTSGSR